jgi:sec-independent protein translocase protein TatA
MNLIYIILGVVGPTEFLLIIVVIVLLFGTKKLPELMKGVGTGIREFKKASQGDYDEEKKPVVKDDNNLPSKS